jgi:hypothetical protein
MKNLPLLLIISGCILIFSCKKDSQTEKFKLLTGPAWVSDSLLANGVDASQPPDGMLRNFRGEVKFDEDYSGKFGNYIGTWRFAYDETYIVIKSDSLPKPLTSLSTKIVELTEISLKITTSFPNAVSPASPTNIRMTFTAK